MSEARTAANKIRLALSTSNAKEAQNAITELSTKLEALQESCGDFVSEADLLRVTASVGTQMAEFVHEVQSLLGTAEAVNEALDRLRQDQYLTANNRSELAAIQVAMSDMRKQLERQAWYPPDIATPDASRRRSKQKISERFDTAVKLVARSAEKRGIAIRNEISELLKSPKCSRQS